MSVLTGRWFSNVFLLQDQSEWFFRASEFLRKSQRGRVGFKCVVMIIPICFVGGTALRVTPHSVFQDRIPHKPFSRVTRCAIFADTCRIKCPRKSCSLLHRGWFERRAANHNTTESERTEHWGATCPVSPFELSRLRGGRFACNTPDVMHDAYAMALIYFSTSYQDFSN